MVEHPWDYKWSSYRANGDGRPDPLLVPLPDYVHLGSTDESRRENYRALFKAHLDPELLTEIRRVTNGNFVLGNERFKEEVAQMLKRRVVPGKSGRPLVREG
jgi:putative transposase